MKQRPGSACAVVLILASAGLGAPVAKQQAPAAAALEAALARSDAAAALEAARQLVAAAEAANGGAPERLASALGDIAGQVASLGTPEAADYARLLLERSLEVQELAVGRDSFALVATLVRLSDLAFDVTAKNNCLRSKSDMLSPPAASPQGEPQSRS